MAEVTASLVKELRERTGLGMMECKKALQEAGADIELAIDNLRKSGQAKAAKKAGNIAADGAIVVALNADGRSGLLLEVNCQTDFVARDAGFTAFSQQVAQLALTAGVTDITAISALPMGEVSIEEARVALVQKIGENIQLRRAERIDGELVVSYIHGLKIGVLLALQGGDAALGRDLAMHVAAANPMVVAADQVPADVVAKEREIYAAKAKESGKPEAIVEKMIEGSLKKFMAEVSLVEQGFVKDPETRVGDLLRKSGAAVQRFIRFQVGEGIEKKVVDFASEVAAAAAAVKA